MPRPSNERRLFPATRQVIIRVVPLALMLIIAALIGYKLGWYRYRDEIRQIQHLRQTHSVVGFTVLFVVGFSLATSVGMPGLPLMVAAGALFGTLLGSVLSWIATMIGAALGYWIARTVGRDVVTRWLKRFKHMDAAVASARHFGGMLRLRLIPVIPLGTANFVGGLARANFLVYLAATAIGVVPAIVVYTYFANRLVDTVGHDRSSAIQSLVIASALLLALSAAPKLFDRRKSGQSPVI
jgi:uncharacterized membrane protein YdjX (TVP38/TMEM64 family)